MFKRSLFALLAFAFFACQANAATNRIFITSGTTWTVPADWNSQDNTIEIIGAGGAGDVCFTIDSVGGGGGGYSKIVNFSASPGASISINFTATSGITPGFAWFSSSSTVKAMYGMDGGAAPCAFGNGGQGGQAASGAGTTKFSGGNGGTGPGGGGGTGAGGGAAGPHGAGDAADNFGNGGQGDNGFGGAGGNNTGTNGAAGTEYDGSHGSGGGGGSDPTGVAGTGGAYGGGGGFQVSGAGALIIITYTTRNRVSSGVF